MEDLVSRHKRDLIIVMLCLHAAAFLSLFFFHLFLNKVSCVIDPVGWLFYFVALLVVLSRCSIFLFCSVLFNVFSFDLLPPCGEIVHMLQYRKTFASYLVIEM